MRISCSSLFLWDYGIEEMIEILYLAGIESIEFWAETPVFWKHRHEPGAVEQIMDLISAFTDQCTVHTPILDLNPSSYNERVCEATIEETLWAIGLTSELGASILTIHPGSRTVQRQPTPADWDRFHNYLGACIEYANSSDVILALENPTPKVKSMCHNPAQMGEVLSRYQDLMMTLDVPHALQISKDNALDFIEEMGDRIVNVHIGAVHNGIPHYPGYLGQNPQTTEALGRLRGSGYDQDLTIEIDDKLLDGVSSRSDKISVLINEKKYIQKSWQ